MMQLKQKDISDKFFESFKKTTFATVRKDFVPRSVSAKKNYAFLRDRVRA